MSLTKIISIDRGDTEAQVREKFHRTFDTRHGSYEEEFLSWVLSSTGKGAIVTYNEFRVTRPPPRDDL
jgi:hypothetical protein